MSTNLSLYTLSTELQAIAARLAEDGLDEATIADTIESISGPFEEKAKAVAMVSRNFRALAAQIKEAEQQMAARRKQAEASAERIDEYILRSMIATGIEKIQSPWFQLAVRKNPPAVDVFDPKQVPDDYWREPPPPEKVIDKALIKQAIKDGFNVPGAKLTQGHRLEVR